jgi:hypothetical protein
MDLAPDAGRLRARTCVINAGGTYSRLVAAHVGDRSEWESYITTKDAELAGKIEVTSHAVSDLDARVAQIDAAIAEATRRGRTTGAMALMEGQRRSRAGLASSGVRPRVLWQPSRPNAPQWPPEGVRSRPRPHRSATSPSSSARTRTVSGRSDG